MIYECQSIAKPIKDILTKDKGSKFIGYAFPVKNEEDIKDRMNEVRTLHPSATHHCYAYRMEFSGKKYRANDDGEPNGTAGLPIYNQLLSKDLTFTLLVVVRYYGGTKLGVSGLIKAYKACAEATLAEAKIITLEKTVKYVLHFPYSSQNDAMRMIEKYNCELIEQTYMQDCELEIEISKKKSEAFMNQMDVFPNIEVNECD